MHRLTDASESYGPFLLLVGRSKAITVQVRAE